MKDTLSLDFLSFCESPSNGSNVSYDTKGKVNLIICIEQNM